MSPLDKSEDNTLYPFNLNISLGLEENGIEEYYGLPPPSIRINDALNRCPIQCNHFNASNSTSNSKGESLLFNDKFLCSLDEYIKELKERNNATFELTNKNKPVIVRELSRTKNRSCAIKAAEMNDEVKNELEILRMRSILDPKRFYKRSELKRIPVKFEIGNVIDSPIEYHQSKKQKKTKRSLVDELLHDEEFQNYNKRKYHEANEVRPKKCYVYQKK